MISIITMHSFQNVTDFASIVAHKSGINYEYIALMLVVLLIMIKSPDLFSLIRQRARQTSSNNDVTEAL